MFLKLIILDLTSEESEDFSRFKVQQIFNSSQHTFMKCPFCSDNKVVSLILKENLVIGNSDQLKYKDFFIPENQP